MSTVAIQKEFISTAVGKFFNPDGAYKFQCKDLIDAYCIALWGNWERTIRPGNANQCWNGYNPEYFDRIENIPGDLTNFPQYGDVVITAGDKYNEFGHIWIAVWADAYTNRALQQNANGLASSPAEIGTLGYDQPGTGPVLGWLRPKLTGAIAPVIPPANAGTLNGIDIANHQKGINIGGTGAQFAIIKATEGAGWTDPELGNNVRSLRAAGIPGGVYHFARPGADAGNTARVEADTFIAAVRDLLQPSDVVVLDWESDNVNDVGWASKWIDIVSGALGRKVLIYMNLSEANKGHWGPVQGKSQLWLAAYPSSANQSWGPINSVPTAHGWSVAIWQYSSTGRLAGYGGDLDLNVFYGNLDAWGKLAAGGFTPIAVEQRPTATPNQCIVEAGDSMSAIAAQFGVDLNAFIAANPGINPDLIYPGQVLVLPSGVKSTPVVVAGVVTQCVVEAGDTLTSIASQFGVDLQTLITLNGITDANLIYPGQVLNLPGVAVAAPAPAPEPPAAVSQCVVEAGDTLTGIAAQFGVSLDRILSVNPGINPDLIYPGQVINL